MSGNVDQRFAPPEAHVADLAPQTGSTEELAGRGTRLGAAIIDSLISFAVIWLAMRLPVVEKLIQGSDSLWAVNFGALLIGLPLFLVIQGVPLLNRGQTLGKMACNIRIVRTDGSKPDAWRLFGLRYGVGFLVSSIAAVSAIWGLLDSLLIFRQSRQCLHDSIADTKVIKVIRVGSAPAP